MESYSTYSGLHMPPRPRGVGVALQVVRQVVSGLKTKKSSIMASRETETATDATVLTNSTGAKEKRPCPTRKPARGRVSSVGIGKCRYPNATRTACAYRGHGERGPGALKPRP